MGRMIGWRSTKRSSKLNPLSFCLLSIRRKKCRVLKWDPITPIADAKNTLEMHKKKDDEKDEPCDGRVGSKSGCEEAVDRNGTLPTFSPVADTTENEDEDEEGEPCDGRVGSKSGCEEAVDRNGTLPTFSPVADTTENEEGEPCD